MFHVKRFINNLKTKFLKNQLFNFFKYVSRKTSTNQK